MSLTARDVMSTSVSTVHQDTPATDLIKLFRESHFTGIPVVDDEGKAVGLVSESDILRALAYAASPPDDSRPMVKGRNKGTSAYLLEEIPGDRQIGGVVGDLLRRKARELMSPVVISCRPEEPLAAVCETLVWKEVHRVIVTKEDGTVVGLISALDTVRSFGELLRKQERGE
jgi:CBS-domain-containing membrane protein